MFIFCTYLGNHLPFMAKLFKKIVASQGKFYSTVIIVNLVEGNHRYSRILFQYSRKNLIDSTKIFNFVSFYIQSFSKKLSWPILIKNQGCGVKKNKIVLMP